MNPSQIDEDSDLLEVVFDDSALHVESHVESIPSHNLLYLTETDVSQHEGI